MTTNKQPKNTPITITDFVSDDDSTPAVQECWLSAAIAASYQQPARPKNTPLTITDFVSDDDSTLAVLESCSPREAASFLAGLSAAIAASYQQPARPSDTSVFERLSVPSLNLSKAILVAAADLDKRWRSDCIAVANYLTRRLGYIAITEEAAVIASQS